MKTAERQFTTISGVPVEPVYGPGDLPGDFRNPEPGEFPYTRGIHRDMYRGKLWTMRQFSGFATPEETNQRYHYLLAQGQTGLSVAFDLPTLMGYDADHALSEGEVGKCGAPISSLEDMEILFRGIPLGDVSVSMTINSPASVIWAMYLAVAEQQGVRVGPAVRHAAERHSEGIHRAEGVHLPAAAFDAAGHRHDRVRRAAYAALQSDFDQRVSHPRGRLDRRAGTGVHACATASNMWIGRWSAASPIDDFAPRLSFFFNAHNDFFEEIAKYRAARKIWAHVMRDRYGAQDERSLKLRFHAQTAGCSLTWQQPYNNVVRTALQALAAVLGGAQSLHTNSLDEAYALPSEHAVTIALRTQQVLAYESGVAATRPTPWAAATSWKSSRSDSEAAANDYIRRIDEMGGMIPAIEAGFPQTEIAAASYRYQREIERGEQHRSWASTAFRATISRSSCCRSTRPAAGARRQSWRRCGRGAIMAKCKGRSMRCERAAEGTENTMPFCWTRCAPTRRWARSATRCAGSSAPTRKRRHI